MTSLSINEPVEGLSGEEFPVQDYMMLGQEVGPRSRMEMRLEEKQMKWSRI